MKAKFPPLKVISIEDLFPGHVLWGWEEGGNYPRKGWHLEDNGEEVVDVEEMDDRWVINQTHFLKSEPFPLHFLIEESS